MNFRWTYLMPALLVTGGAAYFTYRYFSGAKGASLTTRVGDRLPVSKALPTIADVEGNYDIDGVSYDTEGTIISSDSVKPVETPIH